MDGVLTDFEKHLWKKFYEKHPEKNLSSETNEFKIEERFPEIKEEIKATRYAKGFIENLPLEEGAIEGLKELSKKHEIIICTSPSTSYKNSVLERYKWVEKNLGFEWTKKIILTKDKTLIKGDILIDDKPEISGICKPEWEHIIFDREYNKHIKDKKRINWKNYKEALGL